MKIEDKTVLVTGCTGFLGGHLVKRLAQLKRTRIRGLIRHPLSSTIKIAGLSVEKVFGDMTSFKAMLHATRGCDVIVHCAVGNSNENAIGTHNIIKAALEHGVKKFIHISTTSVFGCSPSIDQAKDERLTHESYENSYLTPYCQSKIDSEKIAFSFYDSNELPLVILRPSNIFGPYSKPWTIRPIEMLEQGCYVLINGGLSPSNVVYVDNVVDAIILAIKEDNAVGHALTISDDETVSWKAFFSSYVKILSTPYRLREITLRELRFERRRQQLELIRKTLSNPMQVLYFLRYLADEFAGDNFFFSLSRKVEIGNKLKALTPIQLRKFAARRTASEDNNCDLSKLNIIPEIWLEKAFTLPFQFSIKGAIDILGFEPRFSFEDGMKKTEEWWRHCRGTELDVILAQSIMSELTVSPTTKKTRSPS